MDLAEMTSSAVTAMRKRVALHQENAYSAIRDDGSISCFSHEDASSISSAETSTNTTRLGPNSGHVHYWDGTDPIDLVIQLQDSPQTQTQNRRRPHNLLIADHHIADQDDSIVDSVPSVLPESPQSFHPQEEDDQLISTLHRFSMFDTPQRLRYWSSSPPQIPKVARTMLGLFIVALSLVAFCALLSSQSFAYTSRLSHPVIRSLRQGQ